MQGRLSLETFPKTLLRAQQQTFYQTTAILGSEASSQVTKLQLQKPDLT